MTALLLALATPASPGRGAPLLDHFAKVSELAPFDTRLYMMLLDITEDGADELFVAHEQKCGNGGCPWSVYSPVARGEVVYLGEVAFSASGFLFRRSTRTLTYCWHMSAAECSLGGYRIDGSALEPLPGLTCDSTVAACQRELEQIRRWQDRFAPPLLLADYSPDGSALRWSVTRGVVLPGRIPRLESLSVR
jgi:hypothetical protein